MASLANAQAVFPRSCGSYSAIFLTAAADIEAISGMCSKTRLAYDHAVLDRSWQVKSQILLIEAEAIEDS